MILVMVITFKIQNQRNYPWKKQLISWTSLKLKTSALQKATLRIKQGTDLEEIFARDISDKRLLSKMYKESLKLSNKKTKNPIKNGQKGKRTEQTPNQRT